MYKFLAIESSLYELVYEILALALGISVSGI